MRYIFYNQIKSYLKNPIVYLLCIVIIVMLYFDLKPFMETIPYEGPRDGEYYTSGDYDIQQGYLPLPKDERMRAVLHNLNDELTASYGLSSSDAEKAISKIEKDNMTEDEIIAFLRDEYKFDIDKNYFNNIRVKKATHTEIENYIAEKLNNNRVTEFFGRKYSDLLGIYIMYIVIVLTLFTFLKDLKKTSYEVLASKPVRSYDYVLGKILGCVVLVLLELLFITLFFSIVSIIAYDAEMGTSIFDVWKYAITLNCLPACFLVCLVSMITLIFRNPLPSLPVPIMMTIYSNQGVYDDLGQFVYKVKPMSTLTRFPGLFFETELSRQTSAYIMVNHCVLLALAVLCVYVSVRVWRQIRL